MFKYITINNMYVCACLTGRVIPLDLMWGIGTVSAVNNRLHWYETTKRGEKARDMMSRFPRMNIFCQSDDSRGWHGVGATYPYVDPITGARSIQRVLATMAHLIKKKDAVHAATDKRAIEDAGLPVKRIAGGQTDHPAQSEIEELVRLCQGNDFRAMCLACGMHKTNLLMEYVSKVMCPETELGVFSHKQTAYVLRWIASHTNAWAQYAENFMGCRGWWCNIPKMQQDQRWHMTAAAMRWILRLMRLECNGKLMLPAFARDMYRIENGVNRTCWKDFATWIRIPEVFVDMMVEVEMDDNVAMPMNAMYYEGEPSGHCIRKQVIRIMEVWRPFFERFVSNPFQILVRSAVLVDKLPDPEKRVLKRKQV